MDQDTRHLFFNLLRSALPVNDFSARVSILLENDPFFIPGYLEHIWFAEENNDKRMQTELIDYTRQVISLIYSDSNLREKLNNKWTDFELQALRELLTVHRQNLSFPHSLIATIEQFALRNMFTIKNRTLLSTGTFLERVKTINITQLAQEVQRAAPFWWNMDTARAQFVSHHQHTHAIVLRHLVEPGEKYNPVDGPHESRISLSGERFPLVHSQILRLAEELHIGLGRVALVRLEPYSQAYRHYDSENYLKGRKRYHLVVQSGEKNLLSSGDENVYARPGELWFFDNKVMHRAVNQSAVPRVHIIFDGHPLESF